MRFKKVSNTNFSEKYKNNFKMASISKNSGGYVLKNKFLFKSIFLSPLNKFLLKEAVNGTNIFKIGDGGEKLLFISGVHGNELSSQVAILHFFEYLLNSTLDKTIYIVPFLAPYASMCNTRRFDSKDLNRSGGIEGTLSNKIINFVEEFDISRVADFHTTGFNSNPGIESIFCSREPMMESYNMAEHISEEVGSKIIENGKAGFPFKGAIEDECNLCGVPAITCEVLSPFGSIKKGSIERSFLQMKSFLSF